MPIYKGLLKKGFLLPECEKHFHDHDETWLILSGNGTGYWLDPQGHREEFYLESGDVWMVPAGYEHGSLGPNSPDFSISVVNGTLPQECHSPGHYYMEREGYIPSLKLEKLPTDRYAIE
ncbi:MAG: hypothetical protein HOH43_07330 [Candidatus Latescibacteria bacterium]|jgi:hypothetical protein|nr:hypothetical protein [Candidatus Latescibacterota bacterium]